ncbi:MAG: 50S ribosomal protein L21e [Candidatus Woesearchaeota archaeon]|nr:50S ribosomal protein L21e [Candidatus Woesearchaeota archaeon]
MTKRIGSSRKKTRNEFKKGARERGKISLTRFFANFKNGEKVVLLPEPAYQKGLFFPRFIGKVGTITEKIKNCYNVLIQDRGKKKVLLVHPIHLKKVE